MPRTDVAERKGRSIRLQQIKMIAQRTGNEDEYENDGDLTIAKALQEFVSGDDTRNDEDQHGDEKIRAVRLPRCSKAAISPIKVRATTCIWYSTGIMLFPSNDEPGVKEVFLVVGQWFPGIAPHHLTARLQRDSVSGPCVPFHRSVRIADTIWADPSATIQNFRELPQLSIPIFPYSCSSSAIKASVSGLM